MLKKAVDSLAHSIALSQGLDDEREAVIAYGMLAFSQMLIILLLSLVSGFVMGAVAQCVAIYLVVGIFRKFTGGAHGYSMLQCILVSVGSLTVMAAVSKYVFARYFTVAAAAVFTCFVFLFAAITVFLKAPVDSPNKPIINPRKIRRLRISSFVFLFVLAIICFLFLVLADKYSNSFWLSLESAVVLSLLWQSTTLTPVFSCFQ